MVDPAAHDREGTRQRHRLRGIGAQFPHNLTTGPQDADLILLVAWAAIGIGTALTDGNYAQRSVVIVGIGVLALLITVAQRVAPGGEGRTVVIGGSLAAGTLVVSGALLIIALVLPAGRYGSGPALYLSRTLTVVAAFLIAARLILRLPRSRLFAYLVVGIMTAAGSAMIVSSPRPPIDVWFMLQAAAHGLSHGQDIYAVKWTSGVPGELSNKFTYLPGASVLLWPFQALFGDVRYGLLAAMALTAVTLIRVSKGPDGALVACFFLLYPRFLFGLEQSWVDPLSLLAVCLMGYAMSRGRRGWAVLAFAMALSCKQYNWLLVPFAVMWQDFGWRRTALSMAGAVAFVLPWALVNPHSFISGAFTYNLDLPARLNSLSLYTTLVLHGHNPGLGLTATAIAVVMATALWRLPRDVYGFFLGSATVVAVYDLFNRLSFYDAWEFAAGLILFAVVFGRALVAGGSGAGAVTDASVGLAEEDRRAPAAAHRQAPDGTWPSLR